MSSTRDDTENGLYLRARYHDTVYRAGRETSARLMLMADRGRFERDKGEKERESWTFNNDDVDKSDRYVIDFPME
jgi:hypothetical protein